MTISTTRRGFLGLGSSAVAAGAVGAFGWLERSGAQTPLAQSAPPPSSELKYERPPGLKAEDVQAFVGAAHRDIDKVRGMLESQPSLVNAAWDWGSGDWETALGAAGHVGRPEIAELLLSRGARLELHAAAMLGWLNFVKAAVADRPGAENILGPHAIPMHSHARAGGEQARSVLDYLESLNCLRDTPVEDVQRGRCAGRYRVEGSEDVLTVFDANRRLMLQPPGHRAWYMLHQGDGTYRPADGSQVKVSFEMNADGSQAKAMRLDDGDDQSLAVRIA